MLGSLGKNRPPAPSESSQLQKTGLKVAVVVVGSIAVVAKSFEVGLPVFEYFGCASAVVATVVADDFVADAAAVVEQ